MSRPKLVLAISPHLDDAIFSAGGTLARLAHQGQQVVVATVFTRSVADPKGFALACQLDKGLAADIDYMALRRAEDAEACRRIGAEARWLPFAEAPHRGYGDAAALFAGLRPDDPIVGALQPALAALFVELQPDLVLAPQAIGGHVDHIALVQALQGLAITTPTWWWRDYPYTIRVATPLQPFSATFDAMDAVTETLGASNQAAKLAASLAYTSQIGFQFGGSEAARAALAGVDREVFRRMTTRCPA